MKFGNGNEKGNGRTPVRGKSIRGHMVDAIAAGLPMEECADYVLRHIRGTFSKRRLREIYVDMTSNPSHHDGAASAPSVDGVVRQEESK